MLPTFQKKSLLVRALTHRSALNESSSDSSVSNERLEFFGDAVLELAVTKFLFEKYPDEKEGVLSAYRSALVKTQTLSNVAREIGLGKELYMSKGEEATGGRENDNILEDTFEAVIGAIYLDQGFEVAEKFIAEHLLPKMDQIVKEKLYRDAKSHLQEIVQSKGLDAPDYQVTKESGPDHDKKFTIEVLVDGQVKGLGQGKSKQSAQQAAASQALKNIS